MDKMTGEEIKQERKKKKLTQKELAEKAGISRNALINYEAGTRIPSMNVQLKIADALEIDILHLKNTLNDFDLLKKMIDDNTKFVEQTTEQTKIVLNALDRLNIKYEIVKYTEYNKTPLEYKIYLNNTSFILDIDDLIDIYDKAQNNFDSFVMTIISTISTYKKQGD